MKKLIFWITGAVLCVAIVAGAIFRFSGPQIVTLKDGTKLTLVAVTYGKHHVSPKILGKRTHAPAVESTNDSVVVWIKAEQKKPNGSWPSFQLFVCDTAGTGCVSAWGGGGSQIKRGVYLQSVRLDAFPRRDRKMILRVGAWNNRGGGFQIAKGEFVISNPGKRSFPQWTPEPLPDTQSDGDLNVTLTKCVDGIRGFGNYGSSKSAMNKAVLTAFHFEQNGITVSNWQPVQIQTSDATGNSVQNNSWSNSREENGDQNMTYQWGLWPNEKAWKLRVEFSRTSGFFENEMWTLTNVPVKTGTWQNLWNDGSDRRKNETPFAETTLNGIHLKIFPAVQTSDQNYGNGQKSGGIRITTSTNLPDGFRMTLEATDERGRKLQSWGPNGGGENYVVQFPDLRNAKLLNIAVALHKSRFIEFTVKPTKP